MNLFVKFSFFCVILGTSSIETSNDLQAKNTSLYLNQMFTLKDFNKIEFCLYEPSVNEKEEGLAIARKAKNSGDRKLAAFTFLNLINKYPGDVDLIDEYQKFITENEKVTIQEIDELFGVISLSAFKVPVGKISQILEMNKAIQKKRDELSRISEKLTKDNPRDIQSEIASLITIAKSPPNDELKIKKLVQDLTNILNEINDEDARHKEIENHINELSICLDAINKILYIKACLEKITTENKSTEEALSLIQAAETALPSIFGIRVPKERLPLIVKEGISELPKVVRDKTNEIAEARSVIVFKQVEILVNQTLAIDWNRNDLTWEGLCREIESNLRLIQLKATEISSKSIMQQAMNKIERVQENLADARRKQYRDYQKWAIQKMSNAFDEYNRYRWTSPGDKAFDILIEAEIHTIDLGLLSPEASRCYSDIVPKLLAQLTPKRLPEWYEKCVMTQKVKLENR